MFADACHGREEMESQFLRTAVAIGARQAKPFNQTQHVCAEDCDLPPCRIGTKGTRDYMASGKFVFQDVIDFFAFVATLPVPQYVGAVCVFHAATGCASSDMLIDCVIDSKSLKNLFGEDHAAHRTVRLIYIFALEFYDCLLHNRCTLLMKMFWSVNTS